jgi:hypothetical protein
VHVRCGTGLSGATRSPRSNGRLRQNPNGWVMWLAHRTVRCAHRQQPAPTACWWLRAINTPQPPPLQASKHSLLLIRHKSKSLSDQCPKFNSSSLGLVKITYVSCCSCLLGLAFFSFSLLTLKCFVSEARDTNCVAILARSK